MKDSYDIGDRLKYVMRARNFTISQLAEAAGISEDTIKSIRSGKIKNPSIYVMIAIADALNISLDGLLHRQSMSDDEIELLRNYRILSSHGKNAVQMTVEAEKHLLISSNEKTRRILCIVPTQTKSSDVDFSMHNTDYITIPESSFPEADMAVQIITNNLYPVFSRGDILAVEKKFPSLGALGIFVDGQGTELIRKYVEKDGTMILEPISKCNKTVIYSDDIVCLGRILGIIRLKENTGHEFLF